MTTTTRSADPSAEPAPNPDRTRSAITVGIAAVVFVAVLAGVAVFLLSDDDQPVVADSGASPLIRLAALVPVDEPGFMIEMADLEGMRARAEVPRPASGASPEESQRYLDALRQNGALPLNLFRDYLGGDQHTVGWHDELGVDPAQLHGAGRWGDPPDQVLVVIGTIDPAAVEAAVQSISPLWDEELQVESHRDVTFYSWWDEDGFAVDRGTALDPAGRARRVAVIEDMLIVTRTTAAMTSAIDAVVDGRRSPFADLAEVAEQRGENLISATQSRLFGADTFIASEGEPEQPVITILEPVGRNLDASVDDAIDQAAAGNGWSDEMRAAVSVARVTDRVLVVTFDPAVGDDHQREEMGRNVHGFLVTGEILQ